MGWVPPCFYLQGAQSFPPAEASQLSGKTVHWSPCSLGRVFLAVNGQAWSPCVHDIRLYGTLVHLTSGMSFYGSACSQCEWKDKYLFREQMPSAQGPWRPQLQSEWEPALPRAGAAAAPGGVRRGCAEEWGPRTRLRPRADSVGVWPCHGPAGSTKWVTWSHPASVGSPAFWVVVRFLGECVPRTVPGASRSLASL